MPVYIIAQVTIHDRPEYDKYSDAFMEVFVKFKGTVLGVDEAPETLEGEWPCSRTVVLSFPSSEEATRWYESSEYKEIVQHRFAGADANIILMQGFDAVPT